MTERKRYLFLMFALAAGLSIIGCGGGGSSSSPPPTPADFTMSVQPGSVTVTQGSASSPAVIAVSPLNNFSGSVSVAISGLPSGVTTSPASPFVIGAGASQSVTFSAATSATLGPVNLTFSGTSGSLSHTAGATMLVNAAADFAMNVSPGQLSVTQGATSTPASITVTPLNAFSGTVSVDIKGLPAGIQASQALPLQVSAGSKQQITFTAANSVSPGTMNVVFQGSNGSLSHTASAALQIQAALTPDFSLFLEPGAVALKPGTSQAVNLSINIINGFGDNVSVSIAGLPAGVTAAPSSPFSAAAGSKTAITFTAAKNAPAGAGNVALAVADGSLIHTQTAMVQVLPNAPTTTPTMSVAYVDFGVGGVPGDAFIRIVNPGILSTSSALGDMCANIYVFDHLQELAECCSCPVTANGTVRLGLENLVTNFIPGPTGPSISIDVVPSAFSSSTPCNPTTYTPVPNGLDVWGTRPAGVSRAVETPAPTTPLSGPEMTELQSRCGFIVANSTGAGLCTCPATN